MPFCGLSARRFCPPLVTIRSVQGFPSAACCAARPAHTVSRPPAARPDTLWVFPEVSVRVSPTGMQTKSTNVMLAKSWAEL